MNVLLVFRDFSGAPFSEAADWPAAEDPRQPIDSGHHQRHVSDRLRVCFFFGSSTGFHRVFRTGFGSRVVPNNGRLLFPLRNASNTEKCDQ